jgi:hypothetical protein
MHSVQHPLKADVYRRKAAMCESHAACARSDADREQLLRMRQSCLALASAEDWLDGLPPTPPATARALPVPA